MQQQLCVLKDILRSIAQLEDQIQEHYHLSVSEALVFCALGDGHSTAVSLAERVGLSTSRICRIIASLERKGLIERFRDNHDRRQWENVLTNQGKQKLLMMQEKGIEMPQWLLSLASSKDLLPFH